MSFNIIIIFSGHSHVLVVLLKSRGETDHRASVVMLCFGPKWHWVSLISLGVPTYHLPHRSHCRKTTAIVYKMLWIEQSCYINSGGSTRARQIFITKSAVLAKKVQEHFNKIFESLGISNKSPEELKIIAQSSREREHDGLNLDADLHVTLPGKFSDLRDEHFPLFLTLDGVCFLHLRYNNWLLIKLLALCIIGC